MFLRFDETRVYSLKKGGIKSYINFINDESVRRGSYAPGEDPRISIIHPKDPLSNYLEELEEVKKISRIDNIEYLGLSMPSDLGGLEKPKGRKTIEDMPNLRDGEILLKFPVYKE